jgi:endonuclease/exonuclease/phosphatase family metal-dependent hydrolase
MSDSRLRVLTANLLNGRADPDALARVIDERAVDVAALQELGPDQARAVSEVLPFGKLEPATDCNGMGIALRRPGEVRRLPLRHRDARVAELEPGEWPHLPEPLEVINLHIQAPHLFPPWETFRRRREQVRGVAGYLASAPRSRRLVAGDFNASPAWPAYRRLVSLLPDAIDAHARRRGQRPPATWGPWPGARGLFRIDHVLAMGLEVTHAEIVLLPGSDHRGVLVELAAGRSIAP